MRTPRAIPKVYLVGADRLNFDLLSFCLEEELSAECVFAGSASALGAEDGGRPVVIFFDCSGFTAEEIESRYGNIAGLLPPGSRSALINVQPCAGLHAFVQRNKICGIFYKDVSRELFIKGVRVLLEGGLWLSRKMLSDCVLDPGRCSGPHARGLQRLSRREIEILQRVASGASNQEVADQLNISAHTVKTHLYNIYRKADVSNRLSASRLVYGAR